MAPAPNVSVEPARPPGGGHFRRVYHRFWRLMVFLFLLAVYGLSAWLWSVESWLRPATLCRIPEGLWLVVCITAGIGMLGSLARPKPRRWRAVIVVSMLLIAGVGGLRWGTQRLAVNLLVGDLCGDSGFNPQKFWQRAVADFCRNRDDPSTRLVRAYLQVKPDLPPNWHFVACSRWTVRLGFFRKLVTTPANARRLSDDWVHHLPAVLGADVDFSHRRELLNLLAQLRQSGQLVPESRDTAILWQALIVLTDPAEFAAWRVPARDAMLAIEAPLFVRYGDVWMRTLDALLAYDSPESWPGLTKPLARDPTTLRRAVRERLRGVMAHHKEVIAAADAVERSGNWRAAFAVWQDCGRWLDAWPGTPWQEPVADWRRSSMARWLLTDGLGGFAESNGHDGPLGDLPADAIIELAPGERDALAAKTLALAKRAGLDAQTAGDPAARAAVHQALVRVSAHMPFLTPEEQTEASRLVAPAVVRLEMFTPLRDDLRGRRVPCYACQPCCKLLFKTWPLLNADQRATLAAAYRSLWEHVGSGGLASDLLCLDSWCERPALDDVEWLVSAVVSGGPSSWRIVEDGAIPCVIERGRPFPVRQLSESVQQTVAKALDRAVAGFREARSRNGGARLACREGLRSCHGGRPFPEELERRLESMLNWAVRYDSTFSGERWLAKRLAVLGLRNVDQQIGRDLSDELVVAHQYDSPLLVPRDGFPDPWATVLQSPQWAAAEVSRDSSDNDDPLRSMLSQAVRTPPPAAVTAAMWGALLDKAREGEIQQRMAAYGALFRLAPLVTAEHRLAMRREFLRLFRWRIIPMRSWPAMEMEPIETKRSIRGGEGIPWEDDALSAALSFSSEIRREVYRYPGPGVAERSAGVFSYLAQAFISYEEAGIAPLFLDDYGVDRPIPLGCWERRPLSLPAEPTPWQRARALHMRRPDLAWPDCAWYRPEQE